MRAGRDLLFVSPDGATNPARSGEGGGGAGAGGEDIARMAEQREDALNGGGEVLVRLDEEIAFDGVSRGIP